MSWHEYRRAIEMWRADEPFYALLMAAMLRAGSRNAMTLKTAFPEVWAEVDARYWAPGGELPGDGQERVALGEMTPEEIEQMVAEAE